MCKARRYIAMRSDKRRALDTSRPLSAMIDDVEYIKASIRRGGAASELERTWSPRLLGDCQATEVR